MSTVNAVRGEAEAKVGDMTIRMVVGMDSLARLSEATGRPSLQELFQRLLGTELSTTRDAILLFTMDGVDAQGKTLKAKPAAVAAVERLSLSDTAGLQVAFTTMLNALVREQPDGETERPNE